MGARRARGAVGVIGLGIMGGAFAKNLAKAGWRVVGFDISAARRREAIRASTTRRFISVPRGSDLILSPGM